MSTVTAVPQVAALEETLAELLEDGLFIDGDWIETKDQDPNGEVRLIQLADVGDGVFRDRSSRFLTMSKAKEVRCTFLQPGDILVARMPEPLGRACIFPGVGQPAITAVDVCILRPNPDRARVGWLVKAVNSPEFRAAMQEFVRGTTRQRISRKNLGTLRLAAPSVEEQIALADLVDRIELKRGAAADHVGQARRAIERFRDAVLAASCSGRLTADWRERNDAASSGSLLVEAAREQRVDALGPRFREPDANGHANFPECPASWELSPLGLLLTEIKYGTSKRLAYDAKGIPVLRIPNVSGEGLNTSDLKYADLSHQEAESLRLCVDDLLMIRSNGSVQLVGRTVVVDEEAAGMAYAGYLMRLRTDPNALAPALLGLTLGSPQLRHQIEMPLRSTSGVNNINTAEVRGLVVPVPPLEEQAEIVRRVHQLLALADSLATRVDAASDRVERSSQAVLAKAFRGELSNGYEAAG